MDPLLYEVYYLYLYSLHGFYHEGILGFETELLSVYWDGHLIFVSKSIFIICTRWIIPVFLSLSL